MHTHTVPSAPPQSLNGVSLSPTILRLVWTRPLRDQLNGIIREYQISFTELETGRMWNTTTTRLLYVERGLHAYYEYECSVAAVTVGAGPAATITVRQPEDGNGGIYCLLLEGTPKFSLIAPQSRESKHHS